jgi:hypothetical protein
VPAACPSLRATVFSNGSCASGFRVIDPPIATVLEPGDLEPRRSLMPCYERNPGARPGLPEPFQNQLAASCETRTARPCLIDLVAAADVKVGRKDKSNRPECDFYGLRGCRRDLRLAYSPKKRPNSIGAVRPQSEMRFEGEAVKPDKQRILASSPPAVTAESTALDRTRPVKTPLRLNLLQ